jgi:integrative and conjugative element protein (TIGR02256 family)
MRWWPRLPSRGASAEPYRARYEAAPIVLPASLVDEMRTESERGLPNETGGVLVGHIDPDGRSRITAVVGPGPSALRTRNRFRRDGEYAQVEVDRLHRESDGRDDYLGEWHSHPQSVPASVVDRGSMEWIGTNERYHRDEPVLVIMQRTGDRAWRPLTYRWVRGRLIEVDNAPEGSPPRGTST